MAGGRHRAPSCCQVVGRFGGTLGPLDDGWALLPPQQLVVLEEALVAGHPVGTVREGQETWTGEGRAGTEGAGSSTHWGQGWDGEGRAGDAGWGHASWGRMDLRLPTPCCQALTKAVHAPAFELALKGHIVEAGKNADAVELPLHKLPLVPEGEEFLRQKLPAERGDAWGVHTGVPRSPGAIREGEHTTAMEESILKVPHVSGAISKRQLPHTMPAT